MQPLLTDLTVERTAEGEVQVSWAVLGAPVAVDVAHGHTPEAIDHQHQVTAPAGTTVIALDGLGPGPHFVSVAAHGHGSALVAGERRVWLEGLQNLRDLGGYAAGDGHTRWGVLFRADSLHKLTPADHRALARLGLGTVFDLRGDRERETHPNPIPHAQQLAVVGRPPEIGPDAAERARAEFVSNVDGERLLRDLYVGMLVHSAPLFGTLFRGLLAPDGLPSLFHCHAGKDRTGVVAALVLLGLGVSTDQVLDDYELTRRYRTLDNQHDSYANMIDMGMSPEAAAGVLSTPRWAMEDALTSLEADHGGIERYLTGPVGLSAAQLDELRARLIA